MEIMGENNIVGRIGEGRMGKEEVEIAMEGGCIETREGSQIRMILMYDYVNGCMSAE